MECPECPDQIMDEIEIGVYECECCGLRIDQDGGAEFV